jgi:ABC-type uncharacterized transport system involved in gliding motility auxiliary subunit
MMNKVWLKNIVFVIALIAASAVLYQLAARFPAQADVTQNALNSLDKGSVDVLNQMDGEIKITVYVVEQEAKFGDVRKLIREFVALYQRYKSDISLTLVDPVKEPDAVRNSGIKGNGEMVVEYGGRREHITTLNEQTLTSALLRLAHNKDQMLMYLSGHGERKLDGTANHDLGEFGQRLQQNGYRIAPLNLTIAQDVPDNISLLVITQPQTNLFKGETDKLLRFIARGGNVLWLLDAEPLRGLEPVAEKLGLALSPGIVIDPAAREMNAPADWTLGTGYAPHAITSDFDLITVFPFARALGMEDNRDWQRHILVEGAMNGWVSTSKKPRFDKNRDIPGPFTLALAQQRTVTEKEQRVVVVGSGSFLANAYSGNGGNLALGVNMVNWLGNEERLITLAPQSAKDGTLTYSTNQLTVLSVTLLVVIPLLLIFIGVGLWWRRR